MFQSIVFIQHKVSLSYPLDKIRDSYAIFASPHHLLHQIALVFANMSLLAELLVCIAPVRQMNMALVVFLKETSTM